MLTLASPALGQTVLNFPDLVDTLKQQSQPILKMMEIKAPAEMVAYLQKDNLTVNAKAYVLMTNLKTVFGANPNTMKINLRSGNNIARALNISNALKESGLILTMSFMNDQLNNLGNLSKAVLEVYLNNKLVAVFKNVLGLKDDVEYSLKVDKNNVYTPVATHKIHRIKEGSSLLGKIKVPLKGGYPIWFKMPFADGTALLAFSLWSKDVKVAETDQLLVHTNQPLQNFLLTVSENTIMPGSYNLKADLAALPGPNFAGLVIYTPLTPSRNILVNIGSFIKGLFTGAARQDQDAAWERKFSIKEGREAAIKGQIKLYDQEKDPEKKTALKGLIQKLIKEAIDSALALYRDIFDNVSNKEKREELLERVNDNIEGLEELREEWKGK